MSDELQCCPRAEIDRAVWDAFVDANEEAWFWHRSEYINARSLYSQYVDVSFGVRDREGNLLGVVPLYLVKPKYRLLGRQRIFSLLKLQRNFGWLYSEGGPAIISAAQPRLRYKVMLVLKSRLPELIAEHNARHLDARVPALAPFLRGPHAPRVNPLYHLDFEDASWATWMIDLTLPLGDVRRRYSLSTRQRLKKAANESFLLREAAGSLDLDTYYKLHLETIDRKSLNADPLMSFGFFQHIFEHILSKKFARMVFLEKKGHVIAANNTLFYKGSAYYWTAASRAEKDVYEGRVLFDNQIAHACDSGCVQFEAGQAYVPGAGAHVQGTSDFKRSFGSEMMTTYRGRLRIPEQKPSGRMFALTRFAGQFLSE